MQKEIKARESEVIQRDKVITELRLRLPATADRDKVIDKVMATTTNAMQESDYESQQAYKVAQSTVQSLQVLLTEYHHISVYYNDTIKNLIHVDAHFQ